jgi:hypothetical protein
LAQYILADVHEIGGVLISHGYATPGAFVRDVVTRARVKDDKVYGGTIACGGATALTNALVTLFPLTFRDEYIIVPHQSNSAAQEQRVCFYKKAQLVVSEIHMRFRPKVPTAYSHAAADNVDNVLENNSSIYYFSDVDNLTAFVDNVVVAMMRMAGVVEVTDALATAIANGEYIERGSEEEVALRAAALTAVEMVVSRRCALHVSDVMSGAAADDASAPKLVRMNAQKLCNWLWGCQGKAGSNRSYPRHLTPSTSFY